MMRYQGDYGGNRMAFVVPTMAPAVKALLIANGVVFFLMYLSASFGNWLIQYGSLIPYTVTHSFQLWRLVTYMFLHGGFTHILFNMLFLWWFGSELERFWGTVVFIKYYFVAGIGGGLFHLITWNSYVPVIGASGAVMGILLAYGLIWPNRKVLVWFILPVKMKWLVLFSIALAFLGSFNQAGSGVAHLAHLGGMVVGFLYLKWNRFLWALKDLRHAKHNERRRRGFRVIKKDDDWFEKMDDDDDDVVLH